MSPPASAPDTDLTAGTLLGAFEVISSIGRGGMGVVYRVRNRVTGDLRALKLILPEVAANPEFVERFLREIRLAMAVEHPNLVRVFEPGMDGDRVFLPMELLEGETLAARLQRERPLKVAEAVDLVTAVGSALSALHARGIVHRDVKPSNIFLAKEGGRVVPKLLDLGAGKQVGVSDGATVTGHTIGSPHYMAPEQASGRRDLDARADQYSLAVVTYELLTGSRPYENDETEHVLAKLISAAAFKRPCEIVPDIPREIEGAVLRAMSRARDARFATVMGFVSALTHPSPGAVSPSVDPTRALPRASVRPAAAVERPPGVVKVASAGAQANEGSRALVWAGIVAAVLLLLAGGVHKTIHGAPDPAPPPSAAPKPARSTTTPPRPARSTRLASSAHPAPSAPPSSSPAPVASDSAAPPQPPAAPRDP
jgi:serine/threonine-protein kinase